MEKIRVLLVDDVESTRKNMRRMLSFAKEIKVVGEAADGLEAVEKVQEMKPDVVLMDINMPRMDGIAATERISAYHPECAIVIVSVQGESEYLRRAMLAGAREYLTKPFEMDDMLNTIRGVHERGVKQRERQNGSQGEKPKPEVITVFGTKGGAGKTTLAVNLAVLLAKRNKRVALVDLDLQFGDVSTFLNLMPQRTISELVQEGGEPDEELLNTYLMPHISGIKVLPAPGRPEYAELVMSRHVEEIISLLKETHDYVIIDTPPSFNETNLTAIDLSTQILLVMSMDLATLKNVKLSLELLESLHQKGKTKLILNRASEEMGIRVADAEEALNFLIAARIPSDGRLVVAALNKGIPFAMSHSAAKVTLAIKSVSEMVIQDKGYQQDLKEGRKSLRLGRVLKRVIK